MKNINGQIMSKDKCIATVEDEAIVSCDEQLLPLYLKNKRDVVTWLEERAIDSHRVNSRLLKKALRLASYDDLQTVISVHAVTITDTYWFRETDSDLNYEEVRYKENYFDKLALFGDPDSFHHPCSKTPELTNTGSFEKCWRLIDGKWWMYKNENELERFSELFIYKLGCVLKFDMAHYESDGQYVKTLDFTNGASVNFEAIDALVEDGKNVYQDSFCVLYSLSKEIAAQYLKLIYLDTLCNNVDRHTKNYGLLRDVETGEILSLAPNYDNNIALIARGYLSSTKRTNDALIDFFIGFLNYSETAKALFNELDILRLVEKDIHDCLDSITIEVDRRYITDFILNGQNRIFEALSIGQSEESNPKMTM